MALIYPETAGLLDTAGDLFLAGRRGRPPARPGATRGGERAGPTSRPEACVGVGVVWGLTGIREAQGCGFDSAAEARRRRW